MGMTFMLFPPFSSREQPHAIKIRRDGDVKAAPVFEKEIASLIWLLI
jgi:hypothetical protein